MYVYCVVCYREIVAPYVRSVGHVFAYLYTLDDDSERSMDYKTSLLPKVFPSSTILSPTLPLYPHVIMMWNILPSSTILSPTLPLFQSASVAAPLQALSPHLHCKSVGPVGKF